jgi:fibronectin-binding autotransporter adhesin
MNHSIRINRLKAFSALLLCSANSLLAADTWVGNTDANWSTPANWSPANAPVAGDSLIFTNAGTSGASLNNDLANGTAFNGIFFTTNGAAYIISGNDIGLNGTITSSNASAITINNNLDLAATGTVNPRSAGIFALAGVISDGGNGYGFTKSGTSSSVLSLSGANTFTGTFTMNAGTVNLNSGVNNLGAGTNIVCGGNSTSTFVDNVGGIVIPGSDLVTVNGTATAAFKSVFNPPFDIAAQITGTGNCSKSSTTAVVEFSNDSNNYTGNYSQGFGTTLFTSVANPGVPAALGGAGTTAYTVGNATSAAGLTYVGSNNVSTTRAIAWSGTTGVGLTLQANGTSLGTGAVQFLATTALRTGNGATTLTFRGTNTGPNTFAQTINNGTSGAATSVAKLNGGTWILSGNNTYSGGTTLGGSAIDGGILEFTTPGALPGYSTPGSVKLTTGGAGQVRIGVQVGGSGWTSANVDTLLGAATFADNTTALAIDTINGSFTYGTGISQAIGLTKLGANTLTLTGASTYTGQTTVEGGTLLVNGSIGGGALTVYTNAILGGSGTINSTNSTVQAGGTLQGGNAAYAGTLTVTNLNLGAAGDTADPTYSQFTVAAGGQLATTSISVNGTNTINILDASLSIGTNTLIAYTGTIGGNGFAGFQLGALPAGVTANLQDTGSAVQLAVTSVSSGLPTAPANILGVTFSGTNLVINGTNLNGGSSFHYAILTSTNLTLPLTNWTILSTNSFNADGTFNCTNAINPANPAAFFDVKAVQ